MNTKTWRDHARPIVARVLTETAGQSEEAIKKALFDAYPFGMREYHPYKIWLDEIRVQRGKKRVDRNGHKITPYKPPEGQEKLF